MKRAFVPAWLALLMACSSAFAEDAKSVAPQEWRALVEPMLPIGERMVALMPGSQDPQLRQELYSMLFSGMSAAYIGLLHADPEHPDFWPIFNEAYNFWALNPDNSYQATPIDGSGSYKISGFRGTVRRIDFQIGNGTLIPRGTGSFGANLDSYDPDQLHLGKDGSFEVILSPERPAGYKGDWWKLDARATNILVRQTSYDWLHEVDGRFAIERLDRPAVKPRPSAQEIEANLRQIPEWAESWAKTAFQWTGSYRAKGIINKVDVHDLVGVGGNSVLKYIEGLFELGPDEALIYEAEIPKKCRYWNLQLTDELWRSIDWMNRQSSLNGYSARLDKDGKFRAVISATDPGVPNWLDTAGHKAGMLTGRWECGTPLVPTVSKVKVAEIRNYLPADTPVVSAEARDAAIRLRRKGAQLRHRW